MFTPTHTYPEMNTPSEMLDFHRIDTETLVQALQNLNSVVDSHAALLRQDKNLARQILRYENHIIDAQGGDTEALKLATSPEEFDKILTIAREHSHNFAPDTAIDYLGLRKDLLRFKEHYLAATHPS